MSKWISYLFPTMLFEKSTLGQLVSQQHREIEDFSLFHVLTEVLLYFSRHFLCLHLQLRYLMNHKQNLRVKFQSTNYFNCL